MVEIEAADLQGSDSAVAGLSAIGAMSAPPSWTDAEFAPMDLHGFVAGRPAMVDLYHQVQGRYVLFCEANASFPSESRLRLLENDVGQLFVRVKRGHVDTGGLTLPDLLSLPDTQLSPIAKGDLLYNSVLSTTRQITGSERLPQIIHKAREWVAISVTQLMRNPAAFRAIVKVMQHDFSVYTHSVNTCTYAVALGIARGKGKEELLQLGVGALLHDIGKTRVPREILAKPSALNEEEWSVVRQHSQWGVEMLAATEHDQPEVRAIILDHHERLDGSGYPNGRRGAQIDPLASIVAVADVYDALTCERPYRHRLPPFQALQVIKRQTSSKLDYSIFASLVVMLGEDTVKPPEAGPRRQRPTPGNRWD